MLNDGAGANATAERSWRLLGRTIGDVGRDPEGTGGAGRTEARSFRPTPKNRESFAARNRLTRKSDGSRCGSSEGAGEGVEGRSRGAARGVTEFSGSGRVMRSPKAASDDAEDARELLRVSGV